MRRNTPAEAVQIRLNESHNLLSPKVQRIVGNKIPRKPVPNGGRLIMTSRSKRSTAHAEALRKLTNTSSTSSEPRLTPPPLLVDPFRSEMDFEDDLECSILGASPEGTSTPRVLARDQYVIVNGDGSPTKRTCSSPAYHNHSIPRMSFLMGPDSSVSSKDCDSLFEILVESPELNLETQPLVSASPDGEPRVKKHPSPGIEWFENIDAAMITYRRHRPEGASINDPDELAQSLTAIEVPRLRDDGLQGPAKLGVKNRRTDSSMQASPDVSADVATFPKRSSRIPRPCKSPRIGKQTCAIQRLRPKDQHVDELNELS